MQNEEAIAIEEQSSGKLKILHPWAFAAGWVVLALHLAYTNYDWLVYKGVIAGPQFEPSAALVGLTFLFQSLAFIHIKRRWEKIAVLIMGASVVVVLLLGVIAMITPISRITEGILTMFSGVVFLPIAFFTFYLERKYRQHNPTEPISRKQKIKVAVIAILGINGIFALWFGSRCLLFWLLTR